MRIVRIVCNRCGYEEQEDDFNPKAWSSNTESEDVCLLCVRPSDESWKKR